MADLNWPKFNEELDNHLKTVNDTFLNKALPFDDSLFQDKEGDDETDKDKNRREKELLKILHGEDGESMLIEKVNTIFKEKNERIRELKGAFWNNKKKLDKEYGDNKKTCEKSCQTIEEYLGDKEGFIHFLSKAFQNQHIGEQGDLASIRDVVGRKKNEFDNMFSCKTIGLALLVVISIGVQVFLFSILNACTGGETSKDCDVLTNCILLAAMVVLLVCEVLSVLGIVRLSRKKTSILQRLDLILNKIDMRKVSKFEIDRDFEQVLEEMK